MSNAEKLSPVAADLLAASGLVMVGDVHDILHPVWEETRKVHDWRNYIPDPMRERWLLLSEDARIAAYVLAANNAHNEEWE